MDNNKNLIKKVGSVLVIISFFCLLIWATVSYIVNKKIIATYLIGLGTGAFLDMIINIITNKNKKCQKNQLKK